jgi:hypothetical protein
MLQFGNYLVYQVTSDGTNVHYKRVARFQYAQGGTRILDDSTGMFREKLPDGPNDERKDRFLRNMLTWSYYRVVPEQVGKAYPPAHSHPL